MQKPPRALISTLIALCSIVALAGPRGLVAADARPTLEGARPWAARQVHLAKPGKELARRQANASAAAPTSAPASTAAPTTTQPTTTTVTTSTSVTTRAPAAPPTTAAPTTKAPATTAVASAPKPPAPAPPSPPPPAGDWRTIVFDGFDGGAIDTSRWSVENRPANNMGELSFYAADEVSVANGSLVIQARPRSVGGRDFTSGQVISNFDFTYGRVEIRAKMPAGQGFWPALWMLPVDGSATGWLPEFDIYESVDRNGGRYFANWHRDSGAGPQQLGPIPVGTDVTQWHTYGFEWAPDRLTWLLDGNPVVTATEGVATANGRSMFLLITFGVGGAWPGPPDGSTPFPAQMQIDWVRVLQR